MRRGPRPARRAGFTLIELLVVVAILAILAALVAAGIGRVKTAAMSNATNQTLTKLQLALDKVWKATCDECRDHARTYSQANKHPDFVKVVAICEDDVERAEALWMHVNLRRSMPHTIDEAITPITLSGVNKAGTAVSLTLPPSTTFKTFAKVTSGGNINTESAALLYVILTQGGRGTSFSIDDAMQGANTTVQIGGLPFEAFKDAYGTPIAYRRFCNNSELNAPPYAARGLKMADPLDRSSRLNLWNPNPTGFTKNNRKLAEAAVFGTQPNGTAKSFDGFNKIATAISAGDDRNFAQDPQYNETLLDSDDNAFGYRVTRQGMRGD